VCFRVRTIPVPSMAMIPDILIPESYRYRYWKWCHRGALFKRQQQACMPARLMVWHLSCSPVGTKRVVCGRFTTSISGSASVVAGSSTPCRSSADMSDCQQWAKRPLAASGAQWKNGGGWHGHKRRLNWKGKRMNEWMSLCSPPLIETYRKGESVVRQEKSGAQLSYRHRWLFQSILWRESAAV